MQIEASIIRRTIKNKKKKEEKKSVRSYGEKLLKASIYTCVEVLVQETSIFIALSLMGTKI